VPKMSDAEVAQRLRYYREPETLAIYLQTVDGWFDWKSYYRKHTWIKDRVMLRPAGANASPSCPHSHMRCSKSWF
jgi:hypothetical protein